MKSHLRRLYTILLISITSLTNAAVLPLEGRLPSKPGGTHYQAYYDPNLDITWAAGANINGADSLNNQVVWAADLTIGGVGGWRLPRADINGDGVIMDCDGGGVAGCVDNEMGFLYWEEGITENTPSPFSNVEGQFSKVSARLYWSGTEYESSSAWVFSFGSGGQGFAFKPGAPYGGFAWAVRSGDVSAVPVSAAIWLFGSGLLGLVGISRKCKEV